MSFQSSEPYLSAQLMITKSFKWNSESQSHGFSLSTLKSAADADKNVAIDLGHFGHKWIKWLPIIPLSTILISNGSCEYFVYFFYFLNIPCDSKLVNYWTATWTLGN